MSVRQAAIVKTAAVRRARAARLKVYEKTVAAGLREVFTHECDSHALQTAKAARLAEVAAEFDALIAQAEARRNEALAHLRSLGETPTSLAQATDLKAREISRRIASAKAAKAATQADQTAGAGDTADASTGNDTPTASSTGTDAGADECAGVGAREEPCEAADAPQGQDADEAGRAGATDGADEVTCRDREVNGTVPGPAREPASMSGGEPSAVAAAANGVRPSPVTVPDSRPQSTCGQAAPDPAGGKNARAAPSGRPDRWKTAVAEPLF